MNTRVAIDPSLFSYQAITETCGSSLLEKLSRCQGLFIEDTEIIDLYERHYEELHARANLRTPAEMILALRVLSQVVTSEDKPKSRIEKVPKHQLPNEVHQLISRLSDIHRKLVTAACQTDDAVVVIPDDALNCQSGIGPSIRAQLSALLERDVLLYASEFARPAAHLITEGKSDWKHLKAALKRFRMDGQFVGLRISFEEYEKAMGDRRLLAKCESASEVHEHRDIEDPLRIIICVFDRDQPSTVRKVSDSSNRGQYKKWCRDWFSFALPVPPHRRDTITRDYICIEFYYQDDEIRLVDRHGRRLYISNEFDSEGWIRNEQVQCTSNKHKSKTPLIIDNEVVREGDGRNVALTKDGFARYILARESPFDQVQLTPFSKVFEIVGTIINDNFS